MQGEEGDIENWPRWSTIWIAAQSGNVETLERLVRSDNSLVNLKNAKGETALHLASRHGHANCVEYLIRKGATYCRNIHGKTAAQFATENSHTDCLKHLCIASHVDKDECRELLFLATARKDYASSAVLQKYSDPTLGELHTVDPAPERRRKKLEESIKNTEKLVQKESILISVPELPPIPEQPIEWTPTDLGRWMEFQFEADSPTIRELQRRLEDCEISGKVLLNLEKSEILRLLQAVGMLPRDRVSITEKFCELQVNPVSLLFDQPRLMSVGIGESLASFRCVGFVACTLGSKLDEIREKVQQVFLSHNVRVPEPFSFVSLRGGAIPFKREGDTRVGELGFIVLISATKLEEDEDI